jgi:PAS domain S-box-containing protein
MGTLRPKRKLAQKISSSKVFMSPELDKIIRQNVPDESTYNEICELIARNTSSSIEKQTDYIKQLHHLTTSQYDSHEAMFLAYLKVGCDVLGMEQGIIRRIEQETTITQAIFPPLPNQSTEIPLNQVMCQYVVEQNQTLAVHNISPVLAVHPQTKDNQVVSYIGTPLVLDNTLWGTISFDSPRARASRFSETEIEFIELMAQNISYAISTFNRHEQSTQNPYDFIFENMNTPILMFDVDSYAVIEANTAATEFYGYSREEFLTLSLPDINMLPPNDIEIKLMESRAIGRPYVHFPHRLKEGEVREVEDHTTDILLGNRRIRFSIIYDYSDRHEAEEALKHSEANLRAIFDNASQFMFLVDDTARIIAMNRATDQLKELIDGQQTNTTDTIHQHHIKADRYLVSDYIDRALQGQTISYESLITGKNNQPFYIHYRYVPVKTPNDEIIGVCVTGQDITSLKLFQVELSRERNILRTLIDKAVPDLKPIRIW